MIFLTQQLYSRLGNVLHTDANEPSEEIFEEKPGESFDRLQDFASTREAESIIGRKTLPRSAADF